MGTTYQERYGSDLLRKRDNFQKPSIQLLVHTDDDNLLVLN